MSAQHKHGEVSRQLLAEIAMGKYAPSGRLPAETQLARRFHVSRPTVARALRDLQEKGLIERHAGSGTQLKSPVEKGTIGGRQIGLLIPGLGKTEIFEMVCGELASLARARDITLLSGGEILKPQVLDEKAVMDLCSHFIEQQVVGVFFTPFDGSKEGVNRRIAEKLTKAGIPVVLLDRDLEPFPRRSAFDLVGVDNLAGGCLLAEHLIKLGCRRIAFLARLQYPPSINARIAGVREALAGFKIELPPDWIQVGDPENPRFIHSLVAGGRWDAVVCSNDLIAAQLLRSLERNNVSVPRDLRVVGFDDAKYATLLGVSLTTMRQPCRDIAITAFRAMTERISDPTLPPRSILLTPQLVVRESCGAYLPRGSEKL